MRNTENPNSDGLPRDAPTWDERREYFRMKAWCRFLVVLFIGALMVLLVWILFFAPIVDVYAVPLQEGIGVIDLLVPIVIAGLLVERVIEVCFAIFEGNWRTMVAYLGRGLRWLKIAETEVMAARKWMIDVSAQYRREVNAVNMDLNKSLLKLTKELRPKVSAANELWQMAEMRLIKAEEQLATIVTASHYRSSKAIATLALGLIMGLIVAAIGQIQAYALIGINYLPAQIDVLVSGLIIGVSAQPIHTVVSRLGNLVDRIGRGYLKNLNVDLDKT